MKLEEFKEKQSTFKCPYCPSIGKFRIEPNDLHKGGGVYCAQCQRHVTWLKHPDNYKRRPKLTDGTMDEVWEAYGGRCVSCNTTREDLKKLGFCLTVQHVPPFKDVGHEAYLLPMCQWCQEDSARQMKRMGDLIRRTLEKMDQKNGAA